MHPTKIQDHLFDFLYVGFRNIPSGHKLEDYIFEIHFCILFILCDILFDILCICISRLHKILHIYGKQYDKK